MHFYFHKTSELTVNRKLKGLLRADKLNAGQLEGIILRFRRVHYCLPSAVFAVVAGLLPVQLQTSIRPAERISGVLLRESKTFGSLVSCKTENHREHFLCGHS